MALTFDGRLGALALGALIVLTACRDDRVGGGGDETESDTDTTPSTTATTPGSTGGTTEDETDTRPDTTGDTEGDVDVIPPPGGVRRMLGHQYVSSIRMLLGTEAAAVADPPLDPQVGTFDAMATLSSVPSAADIELYEDSSAAIADAAIASAPTLASSAGTGCVNTGPYNADCYQEFATNFGFLAWRRPLEPVEIGRLVNIAQDARAWDEGEFLTGIRYMLLAILQSPNFLYIVEVGEPGEDGAPRVLTGHELVTRMSFFILGRTPDGLALQNASNGLLDDDEGRRALATSMVESPEAHAGVARFFGEFLTVRDLPTKGKDTEAFPEWGPALQDAMVEETMRLVEDVAFTQNGSVLDLFTANYTFVNDELAALYNMNPPGGWSRVNWPAAQGRSGVLTQSGWLAMLSHSNVNSPTRRGVFVMEQLLCQEIPIPPPRVNPEPVVPDPGQTLRESLESHLTDPGCAACHSLTDPIGFAFEHYSAVGRFRQQDNGQPVDATGHVQGIGEWDGAADLAALVAADERLPRCFVDKVFTQGIGFVPEEGAEPGFDGVDEAWGSDARTVKRLLVELVSSPVFRLVDEPK